VDYLTAYNRIIYDPRNHLLKKGEYDVHHIVPRSMGGSDDHENLMKLSHRAHFIAHHLLWLMSEGKDKIKMRTAFYLMSHFHGNKLNSSRNFAKLKIDVKTNTSKCLSEWNNLRVRNGTHPGSGEKGSKHFSKIWANMSKEEHTRRCRMISESRKRDWQNLSTQERSLINSERNKKRYSNPEERKKTSDLNKKIFQNPELRKKISESGKGKLKPGTSHSMKKLWANMSTEDRISRGKSFSEKMCKRWAKWRRDNNRPPKPGDENYL